MQQCIVTYIYNTCTYSHTCNGVQQARQYNYTLGCLQLQAGRIVTFIDTIYDWRILFR